MSKERQELTKEQCTIITDKDVLAFIKKIADHFGKKHPSIGKDEFYSIGLETLTRYVDGYDPKDGKPFIRFISRYIVCEMRQYVRRELRGICQEDNDISFANVVMIEEMNLGRKRGMDDSFTADEKLSLLVRDPDEEQNEMKAKLEPLLDTLSDEDRELIMTRYGFFDNQGDAILEYIDKHGIKPCTFYRKAQAILLKLQKAARKQSNY